MKIKQLAPNQTEVYTADARALVSYEIPVAAYVYGKGYVRTSEFYSSTTSKHINRYVGGEDCEEVEQSVLDDLIKQA